MPDRVPRRATPGSPGSPTRPPLLPEEMTVNAVGPIDEAGGCLATFLAWLSREHGVMSVDLVGHSMGGLFSRAAIRELAADNAAPFVRRLVTLGTPWQGGFTADYVAGALGLDAAAGDAGTERIMTEFADAGRVGLDGSERADHAAVPRQPWRMERPAGRRARLDPRDADRR